MEEDNKTFDNSVPAQNDDKESAKPAAKAAPASADASGSTAEAKKAELKDLAESAAVASYSFIKDLKAKGHNSLGNLIFRETMDMLCAACMASESIGIDKFIEQLETGFYSSGKLLVCLEFASTLGANENIRITVVDNVTVIHKICAASIKTVMSKRPKTAEMQMFSI